VFRDFSPKLRDQWIQSLESVLFEYRIWFLKKRENASGGGLWTDHWMGLNKERTNL
jgi:hypothetical protein